MRTTLSSCSWSERIGLAVAGGFVVLGPLLVDRSVVDCIEFPKTCLLGLTALLLAVLGLGCRVWQVEGLRWPQALHWKRPAGLLDLGVLLYLLSAVIATLSSISPRLSLWGTPASYAGVVTVAGYIGWYAGLRWLVRGDGETRVLLYGVLAATALIGTYAMLQVCRCDPLLWEMTSGYRSLVRTFSTLGHPNHLAAFAVMVLPLIGYLGLQAWRQRIWAAFVVLPLIGAMLLTVIVTCLSRGAWLALAATLVLLAPVAWKRWGTRRVALIGGASIVLLVAAAWLASRHSVVTPYTKAADARVKQVFEAGGRRWLWQADWQMFLDHPITGCGLDCYGLGYQDHRSVEFARDEWGSPNHAHNEILHTLATQGLLGGLSLALIVAGLARCAWLALRRGDAARRGLTWVLCAGLLAYGVQIQFNYTAVPCAALCILLAALLARRSEQAMATVEELSSAPRLTWIRGGVIAGLLLGALLLVRTFSIDTQAIDDNRTPATLTVLLAATAVLVVLWLFTRRLTALPAPAVVATPVRHWGLRAGACVVLVVAGFWLANTVYLGPYEASQLSRDAERYADSDPARSDRLFREAIALTPSQPVHQVRHGLELGQRGLKQADVGQKELCYKQADRCFSEALALVPEDALVRTHRAHNLALWSLIDPAHLEECFAEYDAALARDPRCALILHDAARASLSLRRYDRTRAYAERLRSYHPEFGPAVALLALMDWVDGKQDAALAKVIEAENLNWRNDWPAFWDFTELAATFFLAAGRPDEARIRAFVAMQARPYRPVPHLVMGKVSEREGNREIALRAYQTVLQLCPQHAEATRGVERLQRNPAGQEASEPR